MIIGIIGGLSAESSAKYYSWLNREVYERSGGKFYPKILLSSVDFEEFVALKKAGDWDSQAALLCAEAERLEKAGAQLIILATNTMHKMADQIIASISVPFLHLADATAERIVASGQKCTGLLGTIYTMEEDFYKSRLEEKGLEVVVPEAEDRKIVNDIIYDELVKGVSSDTARLEYQRIIKTLQQKGAQGIILGCTEINMAVDKTTTPLSIYDTTLIHVEETAKLAAVTSI